MRNLREKQKFVRVNEQIRFSPVRVVKENHQLGVMPTDEARRLAREAGLDLVEIVPNARPPVCAIVDYGKFKYEQSLRDKEKKSKAKQSEMKEVRLTPKIGEHDLLTKAKAAEKFLEAGKKVQLTLVLKNREFLHQDEGFRVVNKVLEVLKEVGSVVHGPKFEGKAIICRLDPKKIGGK